MKLRYTIVFCLIITTLALSPFLGKPAPQPAARPENRASEPSDTRYGTAHFENRTVLPDERWEVIHLDFYIEDGQANYDQVAMWWNWTANNTIYFAFENETAYRFYEIYNTSSYDCVQFPGSDYDGTTQLEPILFFYNNGSSAVNVTGFGGRYTNGPNVTEIDMDINHPNFTFRQEDWEDNQDLLDSYGRPAYAPPYTNQTPGGILNFSWLIESEFDHLPPRQLSGRIIGEIHKAITNTSYGTFWNGSPYNITINTTQYDFTSGWIRIYLSANLDGLVGNTGNDEMWLYVNNSLTYAQQDQLAAAQTTEQETQPQYTTTSFDVDVYYDNRVNNGSPTAIIWELHNSCDTVSVVQYTEEYGGSSVVVHQVGGQQEPPWNVTYAFIPTRIGIYNFSLLVEKNGTTHTVSSISIISDHVEIHDTIRVIDSNTTQEITYEPLSYELFGYALIGVGFFIGSIWYYYRERTRTKKKENGWLKKFEE